MFPNLTLADLCDPVQMGVCFVDVHLQDIHSMHVERREFIGPRRDAADHVVDVLRTLRDKTRIEER